VISVKIGKLDQQFNLGVCWRKKDRSGHSNKSQRHYISPTWDKPHWTDLQQNLYSSCRPRRNHVHKGLNWSFQGLWFYRGLNFRFSYWFMLGPCAAYDYN